eukprot:3173163-Rhodomonas_salina.1
MSAKGGKPLVFSDEVAKNCIKAFLSVFKALDQNPTNDASSASSSDLQESFESEHMKQVLETWMDKKLTGGVPEHKEPKDSSIIGQINTLNSVISDMEDNLSLLKGQVEELEDELRKSFADLSDDEDLPSFPELPDVVLESLKQSVGNSKHLESILPQFKSAFAALQGKSDEIEYDKTISSNIVTEL